MNKELKRIFSKKRAGLKGYHLLKYDNVSLDFIDGVLSSWKPPLLDKAKRKLFFYYIENVRKITN